MRDPLPLPETYDPANAERAGYAPDQTRLLAEANQWARAHGIGPAAADARTVHLLLIDVQKDFCFPSGSLYVAGRSGRGALDDTRRMAELIYRNLGVFTRITTTMDTHFAFQIFFASFWLDEDGRPPAAFREVTVDDLDRGRLVPNPAIAGWLCGGDQAWLRAQVRFYCAELERAGRYRLYLWPPHCLLGSDGHALVGAIHEARLFHAFARASQSWVVVKGQNPLTENYSVLRPEVLLRHDGGRLAERDDALLGTLLAADALVVAGQAASHCVKSTLDDLLEAILATDRRLAGKVYVVADCMSAVVAPGADFTPDAERALARYAEAGMHVVRSTEPMASWPGLG